MTQPSGTKNSSRQEPAPEVPATQPLKPDNKPGARRKSKTTRPKLDLRKINLPRRGLQLFILLVVLFFLLAATSLGGLAGYFTGQAQRQFMGVVGSAQSVQEQFLLGVQDQQEGRLGIASQRFEWVLRQDPAFPEAAERLADILAILNATATPTQVPPTITPTPTPDLRPVQELYSSAQTHFNAQNWTETIDTLTNLRKNDPSYQVVEVDRMLFLSLRNRGMNKVFVQGDLNGGMYDLVLAERFSPLDAEARSAREWARIYLMGSSFWDVIPEQAVYFFSQVASAIPSLRDASGWTARERLRGALIQWGDELMRKEEACAAQGKYEQAAEIRLDPALQASLETAVRECTPPTNTPEPTSTLTPTSTITTTVTLEPSTPAPTSPAVDTTTATATPPPQATPTPTPTITQPPAPTDTPTQPPPPTDTPSAPTSTAESPTGGWAPTSGWAPSGMGLSKNSTAEKPYWSTFIRTSTTILGVLLIGMVTSSQGKKKSGNNKWRISKTRFNRYFRFLWPLVAILLVILMGIILASGAFVIGRELALFGTGISMLKGPELSATTDPLDPDSQTGELEGSLPEETGETDDTGLPALAITELTPWDGASRVTVLLLGLDQRDWEAGEKYSRSDTMMLLTLDPLAKTAGILSVPRDMWVAIPGFKHGKINTAYYLGDAYKMPGGGPALAVKTVESFLGVPINYYAQIDFEAFVRFIDELGGVKIDIPEPITVDLLGAGSKTKKNLKPGVQVLPGDHALAYARARYTEGGDFDRARRQQQVVMGIRQRVLEFKMLPTLISRAPDLYRELSTGIRTNMTIDQVIKLALLAQSVPEENIQRGVLGEKYVQFAQSPDGLSILIPIPDRIHELRDQIFATSSTLAPGTPGSSADRMRAEAPRINLYNGTSNADLVNQTSSWLVENGAQVTNSGSADSAYASTTVIDYTGNPFTVKFLVEAMGINPYRSRMEYDPDNQPANPAVDVELIIGSDWKIQQP